MASPDRLPRKLAAILYADVAGYSRLTGKDEDTTHRRLREYLDLIANQVTRHGGHVMHYAGDAVLATFDAVVDALLCAAQIQRSLETHNADLADEQKVQFRIGVNLGDVIEDRGDVYGDGVNVAARLESLAEPGGICISESVYTAVAEKLPLIYEDQGEQTVKNIARPVRVYRARIGPDVELPTPTAAPKKRMSRAYFTAAAAIVIAIGGGLLAWNLYQQSVMESALAAFEKEAALPLPDEPSIAVLAFDNLSGDPEQEFFADGLSENIITRLASVTGMFVIARNSSFRYKGRQFDVRQVGKDLGVRYVLEGSVLRAEDRIRVNAQLIDAATGNHLWAEKYDRELNDYFAVLDDITLKVVTQLEVKLTMGDHARVIAHGTDSFEAHETLLLARQEFFEFKPENNLRSRELSRKAHELDPKFAWAIAQEGFSYAVEALRGWSEDEADSLRQAESLARQALAVDPETQLAYSVLRLIHMKRGQIDEAVAAARRAIEISPNDAFPLGLMSHLLVWVGKPEEAVVLINKALRLEPYPSASMLHFAGDVYYFSGRYDEAIQRYRESLSRKQTGDEARVSWQFLIASHVESGQIEEARAEVGRLLEVHPDFSIADAVRLIRAAPFKDHSFLDQHIELLRTAGLPEHLPLALPDKPSIAVLPFTNMSDDPKQEYFVDGMTEDLITDLSKLSGVFVIARNSSFTYKGKAVDVKQVSRELGVKYVLEGSVRRAADKVRINAQLIDATTGGHLWAERYDGSLDDVFALQDQVTQKIVTALAVSLTTDEEAEQVLHDTDNAQAHDAYLQGWAYYRLQTVEDFARAIPYFEEAITLDASYAQAHVALASLYWDALENDWAFDLNMPSSRAESRANEHLEEALKSPTPLAYILQSRMFSSLGFPNEALEEAEKAVALDPNDATALAGFANRLVLAGRPHEGLTFIQDAMRLDPHHPPSYLITQGAAEFGLERFKEAAATFERAMKRNPDNELPLIYLAATYGHLGRIKDADDIIETANLLRARQGKGELNIEKKLSRSASAGVMDEFDFPRFGVKQAQERIRSGLIEIPALKWQTLVTPRGFPGNFWYEIKGATEIDVATAKSLHDKGVVFIDMSTENVWQEGHIPGAFNLRAGRDNEDPSKKRFKEVMLKDIVDKNEEVVLYKCSSPGRCWNPAFNVAKAVNWGYQKVFYLSGGTKAWMEAGHPVEGGE